MTFEALHQVISSSINLFFLKSGLILEQFVIQAWRAWPIWVLGSFCLAGYIIGGLLTPISPPHEILTIRILYLKYVFFSLAPSKINCQFPSWMQKSWSTLDGDVIWRFDDPTNSTWIKMHTVTSDRFGASSYVERKETQIWCHQVIQSQEGVAKIILYTTEQW